MIVKNAKLSGYEKLAYVEDANGHNKLVFLDCEFHNGIDAERESNNVDIYIKWTFAPTFTDHYGKVLQNAKIKIKNIELDEIVFDGETDENGKIRTTLAQYRMLGDEDKMKDVSKHSVSVTVDDVKIEYEYIAKSTMNKVFPISFGGGSEVVVDYDKIQEMINVVSGKVDDAKKAIDEIETSSYDDTELIKKIDAIKEVVDAIENYDDSDLIDKINAIKNVVDGIKNYDDSEMMGKVDDIKEKVNGLSNYDDSEVKNNVIEIKNKVSELSNYDDSVVLDKIDEIKSAIDEIETGTVDYDKINKIIDDAKAKINETLDKINDNIGGSKNAVLNKIDDISISADEEPVWEIM